MQRVIVLPTHHVADDGVPIDLSGDRFHIGGSERAEVAEDECSSRSRAGTRGGNIRHSYPTRRSKSASATLRSPPSSRPRVAGVIALTTSDARSHAPRYQSASNRCFGDNLQRIGLRELAALQSLHSRDAATAST